MHNNKIRTLFFLALFCVGALFGAAEQENVDMNSDSSSLVNSYVSGDEGYANTLIADVKAKRNIISSSNVMNKEAWEIFFKKMMIDDFKVDGTQRAIMMLNLRPKRPFDLSESSNWEDYVAAVNERIEAKKEAEKKLKEEAEKRARDAEAARVKAAETAAFRAGQKKVVFEDDDDWDDLENEDEKPLSKNELAKKLLDRVNKDSLSSESSAQKKPLSTLGSLSPKSRFPSLPTSVDAGMGSSSALTPASGGDEALRKANQKKYEELLVQGFNLLATRKDLPAWPKDKKINSSNSLISEMNMIGAHYFDR